MKLALPLNQRGWSKAFMLCVVLFLCITKSNAQTGCGCPGLASCGPCVGGLINLSVKYTGAGIPVTYTATDAGGLLPGGINLLTNVVTINSRDGQQFQGGSVTLTIIGIGPLATQVFTTTCGTAIYQGTVAGDFIILGGASLGGGALCCAPVDTDHTAPVFNTACPSNIQLFTAPGTCAATATWTPPTATDNCGTTVNISTTHNPGASFPLGITTVTYSAKDDYDNTTTCSFTVEVIDNINPQISGCPSNISITSGSSSCDAIVNWTAPTASDNCSVASFSPNHTPGSLFPVGITTVIYTAKDAANNTTTCSFTVEVIDNTAPVISNCPSNIIISASSSSCDAIVNWTAPTASDNCSVSSFIPDHASGSTFPVGITTVTYTAKDAANNTTTCSFTVEVTDNTAPVISNCPANISVSSSTSSCDAIVTWVTPTASDNCSVSSFTSDHNSGDTFPVGITTVTYTAKDAANNTTTCGFTVEVVDNTAPVIASCPANISVSSGTSSCNAAVTWTAPTAADNCSVSSFTSDHNSGDTFSVGITTVTYTAKDAANNTTTCSFTVEVVDNTAPVIASCPANISVSSGTSSCNAVVTWTTPTASDNCSVSSFISDHNSGDTFPVGITTVTYTAKDAANNTTTCSFTVEVTDNIAPVIASCPSNISVSAAISSCDAIVTWTAPTASDNCSVSSFTSNHNSGDAFSIGITTVIYTAKDAANNTTTCSFTVEVIDNTAPVIASCPANISVSSGTSSCDAIVTWSAPTASDNCSVSSFTSSHNSGDTFPVGITTITYTAKDAANNTTTCSFTVEVTDNTAPVIVSCPANISITVGSSSSCDATVTWSAPTASDNCAVASFTSNHNSGEIFPLGITTVTYTAKDATNNTTTCSFNVEVTDNIAPVISNCPSNIVVSTGASSCDAIVNWSVPTASDNCSITSFTPDHTPGSAFPMGITTVIYTAKDAANNTITCSFTVEVIDNTAPVISSCPANISVSAGSSSCDAVVTWASPTASDNCSVNTFTSNHNSGDTFPVGITTVTYTAKDIANNTTTCSFTIEVKDTTVPVILNCPTNISVPVSTSSCDAIVTWIAPTTSDNCTIDTFTSDHLSGDNFPLGITTIIYTAKDLAGNITTCSFTVEVTDNVAPQITSCPANISTTTSASSCDAIVNWTPPSASDNCSIASFTSDHNPGSAFPVGITTVTYTAKDAAGNTTTCSFTVEVTDNQSPQISNCPTTISASTGNSCNAIVTWNTPIATDNCIIQSFTSTHNSGASFPIGTTTVTYTAADVAGHSTTCSFDVVVSDDTAPLFSNCPSSISVNANAGCNAVVNWTAPSVTDNCGVPTLTSTHNSGDNFALGITTVTYTAEDANGNSSTCSFTVEVKDNTAPVISGCINADIVASLTGASCETTASWVAPTATDNCTVTLTSNHNPGDNFPAGKTVVTYTATDATGNTATCSFNVIVEDITLPIITCPSDITVSTGNSCDAIVTWNAPSVTDCSYITLTSNVSSGSAFAIGTTPVTYTATDAKGNSSTCTFNVTVEDKTKPVFTNCPSTITASTDESCKAIVNWAIPTATDNCGNTIITSSHNPGSSFEVGTTTVTYTATDTKGNTSQCQFNIMVTDGNKPTITGCPSNIEAKAGESGQVIINWDEPTASVACGTVSMNSSHSPGDKFHVGTTEVEYTATTSGGQTLSCKFVVNVTYEEIEFVVSKLITPNGDGINDVWEIENIESFKDNNITVIDRWGGVIYTASGYDNEGIAWDGVNSKGIKVPTGTYFYTISVRFRGKQVEKKGFIELVRQ